ncbi:MAG: LytTR family transcriptional regulator [Clostridia bacterium]|nr:LytTR family transcriptional regulator [Clostridia bacterium]
MKFKLIIDEGCEEEIIAKVHFASKLTSEIENLVRSYSGDDEICVQGEYELVQLKYSDIDCITIIDRKLFVIDKNKGQYRLSGALSEIEEGLPEYFIRINKSTLANERRIACFKTGYSGGVDAIFKSGYKDYVSRRCFAEIKRRYKK